MSPCVFLTLKKTNAKRGAQTYDPEIKSPMLYRLNLVGYLYFACTRTDSKMQKTLKFHFMRKLCI